MSTYLLWKYVHIVAVMLFLGNIATGLFWAAHAHRSRDPRIIATTFLGIERSDRWFTLPGVVGIVVSGVAMALDAGIPPLGTPWLGWPIALFSASGLIFACWVAPLQRRIARLLQDTAAIDTVWQPYVRMRRRWQWWGLASLLLPVAAAAIMVLKPALPWF